MNDSTATPPEAPARIAFPASELWRRLHPETLIEGRWSEFRPNQLQQFLHELIRDAPFPIQLETISSSDEGRALRTIRFGNPRGRRVLVWARQHGDEPDCTAALCSALEEIIRRADAPLSRLLREQLDILVFPMVNPDGVVRFTRENAQGIDINRDAVALGTNEGAALFAVKSSFNPEFCFNLHDMSPRKARSDGPLVTLAFQAGPFCPEDTDNEVRLRAKSVTALMERECRPWAPDGLARYEADYMHRAFGDSMMRWGVSSILIEAGGASGDDGDTFVRRLFTIAFLRGLHAIAQREDTLDGAAYDAIPLDSSKRFADLLISGATIESGFGRPSFRADLHIDFLTRASGPNTRVATIGAIQNLGDLEDQPAKERIDAREMILLPGFVLLAPNIGADQLLASETSQGFLAAGVTTVACGAGPFASATDREQWVRGTAGRTASPNIAAFEIVPGIEDIRARHGLTELAGFLVRGRMVRTAELLEFAQLFHPASRFVLDETRPHQVLMDLFYVPGISLGASQLRIVVQPVAPDATGLHVGGLEMRKFASELLRHPSQVSIVSDPVRDPMDWLPVLVDCSAHLDASAPLPEFFGRLAALSSSTDRSALTAIATMLSRRAADALRLDGIGAIQRDARADIVAFRREPFDRSDLESMENMLPEMVFLNGARAIDRSARIARALPGRWLLARERHR